MAVCAKSVARKQPAGVASFLVKPAARAVSSASMIRTDNLTGGKHLCVSTVLGTTPGLGRNADGCRDIADPWQSLLARIAESGAVSGQVSFGAEHKWKTASLWNRCRRSTRSPLQLGPFLFGVVTVCWCADNQAATDHNVETKALPCRAVHLPAHRPRCRTVLCDRCSIANHPGG